MADAPNKAGLSQAMVSLAITLVVMGVLMFGCAGTLEWARGWIFLADFAVLMLIGCAWLWKANPEIFAARSKIHKGTKGWDKIVTPLILLAIAAILPVAALDDARFEWAPQPDAVVIVGHVLFATGFMGTAWAQSVNRHFEPTVRIQTDRDHHVITTGPYAVIRHPGYAFGIVMVTGMSLAMGSLFGLIPVGFAILAVLVRTLGEDATLKAELPGYKDYAARVKQRWIPGVW